MEFAVGKPADDSGTRPCEFPWLLPPLYKQVEVRQGWQDKQPGTHWSTAVCVEREWLAAAARAWSWFPCWGSWCCSCAAPRKVSDLGRSAPRRAPGAAGSTMRLSWKGTVSAKCAASSASSVTRELDGWGWTVSALDSRAVWANGVYWLCCFPSLQHKATGIAACLTPKCVCLGGPWRVTLNSSPVRSATSLPSCKLLSEFPLVFVTYTNLRMSVWAKTMIWMLKAWFFLPFQKVKLTK